MPTSPLCDMACLACGAREAKQTTRAGAVVTNVWLGYIYPDWPVEHWGYPFCSDPCVRQFASWPLDEQLAAMFGSTGRAYSCIAMLTENRDVVWIEQHPALLYPLRLQLRSPMIACLSEDTAFYAIRGGVKSCLGCAMYEWSFGDPVAQ